MPGRGEINLPKEPQGSVSHQRFDGPQWPTDWAVVSGTKDSLANDYSSVIYVALHGHLCLAWKPLQWCQRMLQTLKLRIFPENQTDLTPNKIFGPTCTIHILASPENHGNLPDKFNQASLSSAVSHREYNRLKDACYRTSPPNQST